MSVEGVRVTPCLSSLVLHSSGLSLILLKYSGLHIRFCGLWLRPESIYFFDARGHGGVKFTRFQAHKGTIKTQIQNSRACLEFRMGQSFFYLERSHQFQDVLVTGETLRWAEHVLF